MGAGRLLHSVGSQRLLIGLGQGGGLYGLERVAAAGLWPATNHFLFVPLYLVVLYVPILFLLSLTRLDVRHLSRWAALVTVVLIGLALHDVNRRLGVPDSIDINWMGKIGQPSLHLMVSAAVALFIAHSLMVGALVDGNAIARYSTYFDVAWKLGVQLALSGIFVGFLWMILWLGAALFDMLHLSFFREIIRKSWFSWPATFLALAASIHLTDVAPGIISGIRRVALTLMSWLLPILVMIVGGFLVALSATSLTLLWDTRHGAQVVLIAAAGLVFLANAVYQQGPPRPGSDGFLPPRILAWSGAAVGPLVMLLVGLASYATLLRVSEYGWTTNRVILSAIDGVAAIYAIGYVVAGPWTVVPRRRLELTNIAASFAIVLAILALQSPLGDPSRIAVASQVARLKGGLVPVDKFDFTTLRFGSARYGMEALADLAQSSDPSIRGRAAIALAAKQRWEVDGGALQPLSQDEIVANMTPHPDGHPLPPGLASMDIPQSFGFVKLGCLKRRGQRCNVVFLGNASDGADIAVIFDAIELTQGLVAKAGVDGHWSAVAILPIVCKEVRDVLLNGGYRLAPAVIPDIAIGNQHLSPVQANPYRCIK